MNRIEPSGVIGADVPRVDGVAKVTGAALYGADHPVDGAAWAYLATSTIARGRIRQIDEGAARAVPGVLEILTHRNVGGAVKPGKMLLDGGHMATAAAPLASDRVLFGGQIVAVVVAETFEAARAAAEALEIAYDEDPPAATFDCPGAEEVKPKTVGEKELAVGDFDAAFAAAPVTLDERYETPAQHHNPMELFQATCAWDGRDLTVWESTQSVTGYKNGLAEQLGLKPARVRVISPFIGGAFGARGELPQSTALVALAAQRLGRPIKLVVSRTQGFTLRTFRAETRHRVRLGADHDGRLLALAHEGWELTSRTDRFALAGFETSARLYACPNISAEVHNVEADRQTPGFMRAPPELPYLFALESAMDELSYKLGLDPVELRKRNDAPVDPIKGLPFSSRSLVACYDAASEAFGWSRRDPRPGSMRDGDWLLGWGCATAAYPAQVAPSDCRVTLDPDGRVTVEVGAHEIGNGLYTILAQTAADILGVPLARVAVRLGDSDLPAAPITAGSISTASVGTVVAQACRVIVCRLAEAAIKPKLGRLHGADPDAIRLRDGQLVAPDGRAEPLAQAVRRVADGGPVVVDATTNPDGAPRFFGPRLIRRGIAMIVPGVGHKDYVAYGFGAQFVEVRVHRQTGEIRASRLVGAFAAGRIINPRTARSQLMGGQLFGLSAALFEATEVDRRTARYVNSDLAEYHIPDVRRCAGNHVDPRAGRGLLINPLGAKGLGELGVVGLTAAVANAVFHATGVRFRTLPIRLDERLLESDAMRADG